ncbi:hypothetical protein [Pleomorphovibrio marinus]|uniref:hypothetical protein n=1 Tax=Pleomorphovibrio marinus TaxID=2164132 RepID=UPI000E0BF498|nr:hypothetical protein [Pleomorphovibrio marinus]
MKIYEFKWPKLSNTTEWVFAPNIKEARTFYMDHIGVRDLDGCEIRSVPKKQWDSNYLIDPNEPEPDEDDGIEWNEDDYCGGYKIVMSFKEYAEQNTETDMIATTEF